MAVSGINTTARDLYGQAQMKSIGVPKSWEMLKEIKEILLNCSSSVGCFGKPGKEDDGEGQRTKNQDSAETSE